jgi:secreted Zn-dependent insulinase-like peptidase
MHIAGFTAIYFYCIILLLRISSSTTLAFPRRFLRSTRTMSDFTAKATTVLNQSILEKAISDDRIYKQLKLNNGIIATLITDKRSEKSSCALSVRIGAAADCMPGLAHITEHAVFLGSEKYPVENAYKVFLNKNGGGGNAGTGMEHTTYKFNINAKAFDEALDIFSQFFKSPSFNHESICREINAVDAEDSKNRILEARRMLQIVKNLITIDTPYSKFSTGNINTLAYGDINEYGNTLTHHIKTFHKQYYHPKEMALCLIGPQDLDTLEQYATKHFAEITDPKLIADTSSRLEESVKEQPNTADSSASALRLFRLGGNKLIKIKPIRDMRDLTIIWQLPYHPTAYRINPCVLIGYVMNYKGPGSIFSALQDAGYATALSAGIRTTFPNFTFFDINISLTEQGLAEYGKVVDTIYAYIALLQKANSASTSEVQSTQQEIERIWKEMKIIKEINFHYQEQGSVYDTAPAIASNMLDYDLAHILSVDGIFDEAISFPMFQDYIRAFTKDNSLTFLRSKAFAHLPDDQANFVTTVMKEFEEHVHTSDVPEEVKEEVRRIEGKETKDNTIIQKWKHSGEYFDYFRAYYQKKLLASKEDGVQLQKEPFYGVTYELVDLPDSPEGADQIVSQRLRLPQINAFVSYQLLEQIHERLKSETASQTKEDSPKLLRSSPPVVQDRFKTTDNEEIENNILSLLPWKEPNSLWYSKDEVFDTPKSVLYFALASGVKGMM